MRKMTTLEKQALKLTLTEIGKTVFIFAAFFLVIILFVTVVFKYPNIFIPLIIIILCGFKILDMYLNNLISLEREYKNERKQDS